MSVAPPAFASRGLRRASIPRCTVILTRKLESTSVSKRRRIANNGAEEWREYLSTLRRESNDETPFNDAVRGDACCCASLLRPNARSVSASATLTTQAGGVL